MGAQMDKIKKNKKLFGIIKGFFIVILALLLFINVYSIVGRLIFHEALPKLFGLSDAVVLSGSMSPTINAGDLIVIAEKNSYNTGDIVTYENNGLVTHRIVETKENGFITKGDHNNTEDKLVSPDQIRGKVVLILPKIGYIVSFFKTPLGMVIIIGVAAIILEMPTIITKIKNKKVGREYEKQ